MRRFNEAGARTPQKAQACLLSLLLSLVASMRLGRERPRKLRFMRRPESPPPSFNEAGARTPQKAESVVPQRRNVVGLQ